MYTTENQSVISHFTSAAAADNQSSLANLICVAIALTFACCIMRHDSAGVTTSTMKALQQRNVDAQFKAQATAIILNFCFATTVY